MRSAEVLSLQRLVGNAVVQRQLALQAGTSAESTAWSQGMARTVVLQRQTDDGTDYKLPEKRQAIEHARENVTKKKAKDTEYAAAMAAYLVDQCGGLATNFKSKALLEKACKDWWNKPSMVDEPAAVGPPRVGLAGTTITYGATHGDLHFINDPTDKKSAWDLGKQAALTLMETEITSHLDALGRNSAGHENKDGWAPFYITAQHSGPVGRYKGPKVKGKYPSTDHFSIQLQVNYNDNSVSYHGFPDEKIEGHALGLSINKTDAKKLT